MAKLSKFLLNSIFIASAYGNENFAVTSCNDSSEARRPALTLQIAEDYFNNNLEGETGYTLENGHYTKTIGEDDLTFGFSADTDEIILSYSLATTSTGFAISDSASISFAEDSILFECRYSRSITVDSAYDVLPPTDCPGGVCSLNGELTYTMTVDAGELGGNTDVRLTPNFSLGQLAPRIVSCNVSHEEHSIIAMHSMLNNELCVHPRLNVVQSEFGENISFSLRTFRFIVAGASTTNEQRQTISCNLYLEPVANAASTQPADCTCVTADECLAQNVPDVCATLYSDINQTGRSADFPTGAFELADPRGLNDPSLPLHEGDGGAIHHPALGDNAESIIVTPGCQMTLFAHGPRWYLGTGAVHTFTHDDGTTDMPENDNFAEVSLRNAFSSWECSCNGVPVENTLACEENESGCDSSFNYILFPQCLDENRFFGNSYNHQPIDAGNAQEKNYFHISAPDWTLAPLAIGFSDGYTDHNDAKWEIVLGGYSGKEFVIRQGNQGAPKLVRIWNDDSTQFEQVRENMAVQLTDGNISLYTADSSGVKRDLVIEWNDDTIIKADQNTLTMSGGFGGTGNVRVRGVCAN